MKVKSNPGYKFEMIPIEGERLHTLIMNIVTAKPVSHVRKAFVTFLRLVPAVCALFLCACRSTPPPLVVPQASALPPMAAPVPAEVQVDDIPADASPAIRSHLIKLKEMLQAGQISQADYESRRTLLLSR